MIKNVENIVTIFTDLKFELKKINDNYYTLEKQIKDRYIIGFTIEEKQIDIYLKSVIVGDIIISKKWNLENIDNVEYNVFCSDLINFINLFVMIFA